MQDVASGEAITYTYDSLNRLISASGTGDPQGNWSQAFSYDGFGNLLSKIGNNAPNVTSYSVNPATNQITSNGATYDTNGNMMAYGSPGQVTSFSHDEANRLSTVWPPGSPGNSSLAQYSYDTANRRVFALTQTTVNNVYTANYYVYFYGADGKKLGVWQLTNPYNNPTLTLVSTNVWFGGRLIQGASGTVVAQDRLQSIGKYFPYGEDCYNPTPANPSNDQEKFATYTRDSISGLDYAVNRYYAAGTGRFMSADPYGGSARLRNPGSWNRYAYVDGDPVNYQDPTGLDGDGEGDQPSCYAYAEVFADCYTSPGNGFFASGTAFDRATQRLSAAENALCDRTSFSMPCIQDLMAIDAQRPADQRAGSALDVIDVASTESFKNGIGSTDPVSALYADPQAAAAAEPGAIGDAFAANPNGLTAKTVLGTEPGGTIYINGALIGNNLRINEALLIHEALHSLGFTDDDLQRALGLPVHDKNTRNISVKLQKDCVQGKGNN
jgi:RHS repeat-associated protein